MSAAAARLLPILAAALACGGAPPGPEVATRDSAGVRIVSSPGVDRPLPWTLAEERRIGGADEGPASFTAASAALVRTNHRDRIMVLDRDQSRVVVFDADGRNVATMGGQGGGPGEFVMVFELLDTGPGEVAVFDFGKRAVVRWTSDGELLPERSLPDEFGAWNGLVLRGDTIIIGRQDEDSLRTLQRLVRMTPTDTTVLDSLVSPPRAMAEFHCFAARLGPMFAPRMAWRVSGGRIAATRQHEYRIDLFEGSRLRTSVRREVEPVPTTPEMATRMYPDGWNVSFQGGGTCSIDGAEVASRTGMADRLPVVAEIGFGPRGTVWARRHTFPGEAPVTDVFDRDGAYLGTVSGRGVPLGWLGDDRVLFPIEDTETGVTVIGIYRIETPGDGGSGTS